MSKKSKVVEESRNYIKNEMVGLQFHRQIIDNFTVLSFSSILNDNVLALGSVLFSIGIIKEGLNLFKKYLIYFYNNYKLNNNSHQNTEYANIKSMYDEYVTEIANYFKKIGLNDPISISNYFTYIVKKSGLSYPEEFKLKNVADDIMNLNLLGTNIVLGEGCCRHLATLLSDIYKKMGYKSEVIVVKLYSKELMLILTNLFKYINHAVTIVETKDGNIVIDPTNGILGNINNKKNSTKNMINMEGIYTRDKLDFSFSLNEDIMLSIEDDYFIKKGVNKNLNREEIINSNNFVNELKENISCNEFKEKNKKLIKELYDETKELKNKVK